jgi:CHAD domain-containing protein
LECLEKYRRGLLSEANRQLRRILDSADEAAIHDFRVALKRLGALYRFFQQVDSELPAKRWLRPSRGLFKRGGRIRETQIAIGLVDEVGGLSSATRRSLLGRMQTDIRREYRQFQQYVGEQRISAIRLPSLAATGISQTAIRRQRPLFIQQLRADILADVEDTGDEEWHRKRILLKRYRHLLDAFASCPGFSVSTSLLKQITLLEQLFGDWHDRATTIALLDSRFGETAGLEPLLSRMDEQRGALLTSSKIYFGKLEKYWPEE